MPTILEPINRKGAHAPFIAAMAETMACLFPDRRIRLLAEAAQIAGIAGLLDDAYAARIDRREVAVPDQAADSFARRCLGHCRLLEGAFREADDDGQAGDDVLAVTDFDSAVLYALKYWTLRRPNRFARICLVLHSDAVKIAGWRSRNPLRRLRQTRSAILNTAGDPLVYLVLESAIVGELEPAIRPASSRFFSLPHPITHRESSAERRPELSFPPVRIGFLGAATRDKNFEIFLDLAGRSKRRAPDALSFHAIGWLPANHDFPDLSALASVPSSDRLGREEFNRQLADLHYVCMPFTGRRYRLTASGTFLDAVAAQKPVIAIATPWLEEVARSFGDIGFLCRDEDELREVLDSLSEGGIDRTRYLDQCAALARLRVSRSPQRSADVLAKAIGRPPAEPA
jgi:hypothetical protein